LVSVVIGVSPSSDLSYGFTPSVTGPGQALYGMIDGALQH
jgi:hypothetical protein